MTGTAMRRNGMRGPARDHDLVGRFGWVRAGAGAAARAWLGCDDADAGAGDAAAFFFPPFGVLGGIVAR
jgi:hypothetical protein